MILRGSSLPAVALAKAGWWVIVGALVVVLPVRTTYGQTASGNSSPGASPDRNCQLTMLSVVREIPPFLGGNCWPLTVNTARSNETSLDTSQLSIHRSPLTIHSVLTKKDSLKLKLLDIEIAKAELDVSLTDIWHRLIPEIRISANLGVQQLIFIDPITFTPYTLPKDSYRLTVSLSLTEIFSSTQHEQALLTLDRLHTERAAMEHSQRKDNERRIGEHNALLQELQFQREEMSLLKQHLGYVELLFEQGKTDFAALIRAKLQLLDAEKSIAKLRLHLTDETNH